MRRKTPDLKTLYLKTHERRLALLAKVKGEPTHNQRARLRELEKQLHNIALTLRPVEFAKERAE